MAHHIGRAMAASICANRVYKEAIQTREHLDSLSGNIPLDNPTLLKHVESVQELAVQAIDAAWKVKRDAEALQAEIERQFR